MRNMFYGEKIDFNSTNVFNFDNPEAFVCQIEQFRATHQTLVVRVQEQSEIKQFSRNFYLIFSPVNYFEGPTSWKGANFHSGSIEEYRNLIYRSQSVNKIPDEVLQVLLNSSSSTAGKLFIVNTPNMKVKILANDVLLTDEVAAWQ